MPNFDTGHYFLTMLAPVRVGSLDGRSYRHRLQDALARLPNSEVTPNSRDVAVGSPFARTDGTGPGRMTHLARFVVIDDLPYNGREPGDTLLAKLRNLNLLRPQPVDRLGTPYLLFAAEFDAADGGEASLRRFTDALWAAMPEELWRIFGNCHGFQEVADAAGFFAYVRRCQVETTMPFNDYYPLEPQELARSGALPPDLKTPVDALAGALPMWQGAAIGVAGLWGLCLLLAALLPGGWARDGLAAVALAGLVLLVGLLAVAGVMAWRLYRQVMARGAQPLPRSASLPEVLKSLYLQQHFTDFVIASQGADPASLHRGFGEFLQAHRPGDLDAPSQGPGLISLPERALPKGAKA